MKTQRYIIYTITNRINNKQYIGVTRTTLNKRWIVHKSVARNQPGWKFQRALRKYGDGDDIWERMELCSSVGLKNASHLEKLFINEYDTYQNGYNSSRGGELYEGYTKRDKWSDERKQKMSELHKGNSYHEGKCGKDNPRYGKPGTMLGKTHTQEIKNKMSMNHHRRTPVVIHGNTYPSMTNAHNQLGWSMERIRKYTRSNRDPQQDKTFWKTRNRVDGGNNPHAKPITIDNKEFDCMTAACEFYSVSLYKLKRYYNIKYQS